MTRRDEDNDSDIETDGSPGVTPQGTPYSENNFGELTPVDTPREGDLIDKAKLLSQTQVQISSSTGEVLQRENYFDEKDAIKHCVNRFTKIWFTNEPLHFAPASIKNRLKEFVMSRAEDEEVTLFYNSQLLDDTGKADLESFKAELSSAKAKVKFVDVASFGFERLLADAKERQMYSLAMRECDYSKMNMGGNLAAASNLFRWLTPCFMHGMYTDTDVFISPEKVYLIFPKGTSQTPYEFKKHIHFPTELLSNNNAVRYMLNDDTVYIPLVAPGQHRTERTGGIITEANHELNVLHEIILSRYQQFNLSVATQWGDQYIAQAGMTNQETINAMQGALTSLIEEVKKPELQLEEVKKPELQLEEVKKPELQLEEVKKPELQPVSLPEAKLPANLSHLFLFRKLTGERINDSSVVGRFHKALFMNSVINLPGPDILQEFFNKNGGYESHFYDANETRVMMNGIRSRQIFTQHAQNQFIREKYNFCTREFSLDDESEKESFEKNTIYFYITPTSNGVIANYSFLNPTKNRINGGVYIRIANPYLYDNDDLLLQCCLKILNDIMEHQHLKSERSEHYSGANDLSWAPTPNASSSSTSVSKPTLFQPEKTDSDSDADQAPSQSSSSFVNK